MLGHTLQSNTHWHPIAVRPAASHSSTVRSSHVPQSACECISRSMASQMSAHSGCDAASPYVRGMTCLTTCPVADLLHLTLAAPAAYAVTTTSVAASSARTKVPTRRSGSMRFGPTAFTHGR